MAQRGSELPGLARSLNPAGFLRLLEGEALPEFVRATGAFYPALETFAVKMEFAGCHTRCDRTADPAR
jgi:hypothetical protein